MLDIGGTKYKVCGDCAERARSNPQSFMGDIKRLSETNPAYPVCDACGRKHSDRCDTVPFAGVNVSGGTTVSAGRLVGNTTNPLRRIS